MEINLTAYKIRRIINIMNDSVKIASLFESGRGLRPRGNITYYENTCNWIYIVYEGSVRYKDDKRDIDLEKGNLYVLPAGKKFSLYNPPQGGPDHFYALISCSLCRLNRAARLRENTGR